MKYFVVFFLSMLVAVCSAQPTSDLETGIKNNDRSLVENAILDQLEDLRANLVAEGYEPYEADEVDLDLAVLNLPGILEGQIKFKNFRVIGLTTFEATSISVSILSRLTISLRISELEVYFDDFEFNGIVNGNNVNANGPNGKVTLNNIVVSGTAHINLIAGSISDPNLQLNLGSVDSQIVTDEVYGIGDQDFNDFVNEVIPDTLDENQKQISAMINALVESLLN